jgi:YHS domain-containing protein
MKTVIFLLALLGTIQSAIAQKIVDAKHINVTKGYAIEGYDPVSYFTQNKPVKGNKQFVLASGGVNYLFSSAAHLELFKKNPEMYKPQYGGWCAYAMGSYNEKVEVNPETFKILDGKLYLFYNAFFNNTLLKWNMDEKRLKLNADKNWQTIIN